MGGVRVDYLCNLKSRDQHTAASRKLIKFGYTSEEEFAPITEPFHSRSVNHSVRRNMAVRPVRGIQSLRGVLKQRSLQRRQWVNA